MVPGSLLHFNVLEDGLSDAPGAVGIAPPLRAQLDTLLAALCAAAGRDGGGCLGADGSSSSNAAGDTGGNTDGESSSCGAGGNSVGVGDPACAVTGFAQARDFSRLPATVPMDSASRLFGHVDCLYSSVYHHLGGDVVVGGSDAPPKRKGPALGNALRSLFLWSSTDVATGVCTAPRFATEIDLALAAAAAPTAGAAAASASRSHGDGSSDTSAAGPAPDAGDAVTDADGFRRVVTELGLSAMSPHGVLTWDGDGLERLWKRRCNVLRDKIRSAAEGPGVFALGGTRVPGCADRGASENGGGGRGKGGVDVSETAASAGEAAAREFCRVVRAFGAPADMTTLMELRIDERGRIAGVRTRTMQAALLATIERLCRDTAGCPAADAALAAFVATEGHEGNADGAGSRLCSGNGDVAAALPADPRDRAMLVFARVKAAVEAWSESSSLAQRHGLVTRLLRDRRPSVATLVEFCPQWRRLPLPPGYVSCREHAPSAALWPLGAPRGGCGHGQASVVFDANAYELVLPGEVPGVDVSGVVRSEAERGEGGSRARPKSSCVALLRTKRGRRRTGGDDGGCGGGDGSGVDGGGSTATADADCAGSDGGNTSNGGDDSATHATGLPDPPELLLVAVAHLESAPPSNTSKARHRRAQLRALLGEVAFVARAFAASGRRCAVAVAGDFNAVREEFVYGNRAGLYESKGVADAHPPLPRPAPGDEMTEGELAPAVARIDDGTGALCLACGGLDGGELREVAPRGTTRCTRAGAQLVIDFVLTGSVGFGADGGGNDADGGGDDDGGGPRSVSSGGCVRLGPGWGDAVALVPADVAAAVADPVGGVHTSVLTVGSDHLPVAVASPVLA